MTYPRSLIPPSAAGINYECAVNARSNENASQRDQARCATDRERRRCHHVAGRRDLDVLQRWLLTSIRTERHDICPAYQHDLC